MRNIVISFSDTGFELGVVMQAINNWLMNSQTFLTLLHLPQSQPEPRYTPQKHRQRFTSSNPRVIKLEIVKLSLQ